MTVDEPGIAAPLTEGRMGNDVFQKTDVGLDSTDAKLLQSAVHGAGGIGKSQTGGADFHQQRIVMGADLSPGITVAGIQPHAKAAGGAEGFDGAEIGGEVVARIFGGDPGLDGKATQFDIFLTLDADQRVIQAHPFGDPDLGLHQIAHGHHFGHRVLDLDPRIGLDEVEILLLVHQKLDGAGIDIIDRANNLQRQIADFLAFLAGEIGRRRQFDDLLMPPLDRAVPLEIMHDVAVLIPHDLDFDVLGILQVFFQKDRGVAESGQGLGGGRFEAFQQFLLIAGHPHATAATTGGGLDDDRIAALLGENQRVFFTGDGLGGSRHNRNPGLQRHGAGRDLVTQTPLDISGGSNESDAGPFAGIGEIGVFGEKAVTRVNRIHLFAPGQVDNLIDAQVSLDRTLALADLVGLVGLVAVQGELVLFRVNRHRLDAQFGAGPENADGNFPAVGCHDLFELLDFHQTSSRVRPVPTGF